MSETKEINENNVAYVIANILAECYNPEGKESQSFDSDIDVFDQNDNVISVQFSSGETFDIVVNQRGKEDF